MEISAKQIVRGFIQHACLRETNELEASFLEELVGGFESNPKEARRAMRKLLAHDKLTFFASACRILKSGSDTAGREYLMTLLLEGELLLVPLGDPTLFPVDTAVGLAKDLVRLDPLLDFKLMQLLFGWDHLDSDELDIPRAQRVLEIVAVLPKHTRILPLLLKLLRFPNPRLRSKAVLLFCQISQNPQWAERRLADDDARVRANAVEGLWGNDKPGARAVLREAERDADHRVVANARVGLYYLEGRTIAPQLEAMARQASTMFRAAAAFAMGQTLDDHFVPVLNSMVKDFNPRVRRNALRALIKIRKQSSALFEQTHKQPAMAAAVPELPASRESNVNLPGALG
jgi:HEAT repeat protein